MVEAEWRELLYLKQPHMPKMLKWDIVGMAMNGALVVWSAGGLAAGVNVWTVCNFMFQMGLLTATSVRIVYFATLRSFLEHQRVMNKQLVQRRGVANA